MTTQFFVSTVSSARLKAYLGGCAKAGFRDDVQRVENNWEKDAFELVALLSQKLPGDPNVLLLAREMTAANYMRQVTGAMPSD